MKTRTATIPPLSRLAILGAGAMGSALARKLAASGFDVALGSRRKVSIPGVRTMSGRDAVRHAQVVFLAVPWPFGCEVVAALSGDLSGRILVDVSNPEAEDGRGLQIGHTTSGAEELAKVVPGSVVVKAFSHLYAELLVQNVSFDGGTASVLYCGDDERAKAVVDRIIVQCGFDPVDAGPLAIARYLEPLAMLTVQLVREQGLGPTGMAWRVMRPW